MILWRLDEIIFQEPEQTFACLIEAAGDCWWIMNKTIYIQCSHVTKVLTWLCAPACCELVLCPWSLIKKERLSATYVSFAVWQLKHIKFPGTHTNTKPVRLGQSVIYTPSLFYTITHIPEAQASLQIRKQEIINFLNNAELSCWSFRITRLTMKAIFLDASWPAHLRQRVCD